MCKQEDLLAFPQLPRRAIDGLCGGDVSMRMMNMEALEGLRFHLHNMGAAWPNRGIKKRNPAAFLNKDCFCSASLRQLDKSCIHRPGNMCGASPR